MIYHDIRSPLANIVSSLDVFDAMLPADGDPEMSEVGAMKRELVLRGVPASRIRMEHEGQNNE